MRQRAVPGRERESEKERERQERPAEWWCVGKRPPINRCWIWSERIEGSFLPLLCRCSTLHYHPGQLLMRASRTLFASACARAAAFTPRGVVRKAVTKPRLTRIAALQKNRASFCEYETASFARPPRRLSPANVERDTIVVCALEHLVSPQVLLSRLITSTTYDNQEPYSGRVSDAKCALPILKLQQRRK